MRLVDIFLKSFGIVLMALGTILTLHGQKVFSTDVRQSAYLFFAALVLFVSGSLFILLPSKRTNIDDSKKDKKPSNP